MRKTTLLIIAIVVCVGNLSIVKAEYRAYLLEVYDHFDKKKSTEMTGFSPDKYILTHGGSNRVSVSIKATWRCYGDTSSFDPVCPMPKAIDPVFKVGENVKINLEKHITNQWVGKVELSLYRDDVRSNVYGIRFENRRNLYGRYFEHNLVKVEQKEKSQPENPEQNQ